MIFSVNFIVNDFVMFGNWSWDDVHFCEFSNKLSFNIILSVKAYSITNFLWNFQKFLIGQNLVELKFDEIKLCFKIILQTLHKSKELKLYKHL